jgi:hypothetical protein
MASKNGMGWDGTYNWGARGLNAMGWEMGEGGKVRLEVQSARPLNS